MSKFLTIHFEDNGQDFLEWDIDSNKIVIDSRPFQYSVWQGTEIIGKVEVGKLVKVKTPCNHVMTIKYPVTEIVPAI